MEIGWRKAEGGLGSIAVRRWVMDGDRMEKAEGGLGSFAVAAAAPSEDLETGTLRV
jgi:hypothetical protein